VTGVAEVAVDGAEVVTGVAEVEEVLVVTSVIRPPDPEEDEPVLIGASN
jgi:hypothetical protein